MNDGDPGTIVLQELRLHTPDTSGAAARIVARMARGTVPGAPAVPLLTSIDDERDVAIVRRLRAGDASLMDRDPLDQLVERWEPEAFYEPRIAEHSAVSSSTFRLAVTGSGLNDAIPEPGAHAGPGAGAASPIGLLWIGTPIGTHAGLLTLIGNREDPLVPRSDPTEWPLPLARQLGVRIYESR